MAFKDRSAFAHQNLHRTHEGYLTGTIRVTCAGVFRYLSDDGKSVDRVLRPETEVGDLDSVASANSKPVTLHHPDENVDVTNIKKFEVGFTGTDAFFDGIDLWVTITITDQKAIAAIEAGEVEAVSMGYDCLSIEENNDPLNNWRGCEYNKIQHGIRYNHLALVYAGRAGESVQIAVGDSIDPIININKTEPKGSAKDNAMKKNIIIDGAVYETDEAVAAKLSGLEKQLAEAEVAHKAALDSMTAERDTAKASLETVTAERDAAKAEVTTLKEHQMDEAEIARRVDEKIKLVETAKAYGCEVKAEDSAIDIKKSVVAKAFGDKMDLNGKSDEYVAVAFDSACIHLDGMKKEDDESQPSPFANNLSNVSEDASSENEKAYRDMCDKLAGKAVTKEA